jgi:hypothetical protein
MKVALCFIISYQHILNKEQLWIDWIKPNQDILNVYFHYKDFNLIKSPWIKMYTIPPELTHQTTYYNVVPAYMSLLSYAFHHDKENLWFAMLTDSCVPIISPSKFRQLFFDHYQASIFKWRPAYWNINIHRRANLWLLKKEYWLANDPWFTLSRHHVQHCILFMAAKNGLYKQINDGGLANESIFAIMLQTFNELTNQPTLINSITTITDWTRMTTPTSPYLFKDATEENINIIEKQLKENKYAMFLRKVDREFPDATLLKIMDTDFGHTYDTLYNQAKKKVYINRKVKYTFSEEDEERNWVIPKSHSRYICVMSICSVISASYAVKQNLFHMSIGPFTIFLSSINYWRKPVYGFRRNFDIGCSLFSLTYHILCSIKMQRAFLYCSIMTIACLCWPLSWYMYNKKYFWTSTIIHGLIHVIGNIGNFALIYGPICPKNNYLGN